MNYNPIIKFKEIFGVGISPVAFQQAAYPAQPQQMQQQDQLQQQPALIEARNKMEEDKGAEFGVPPG